MPAARELVEAPAMLGEVVQLTEDAPDVVVA